MRMKTNVRCVMILSVFVDDSKTDGRSDRGTERLAWDKRAWEENSIALLPPCELDISLSGTMRASEERRRGAHALHLRLSERRGGRGGGEGSIEGVHKCRNPIFSVTKKILHILIRQEQLTNEAWQRRFVLKERERERERGRCWVKNVRETIKTNQDPEIGKKMMRKKMKIKNNRWKKRKRKSVLRLNVNKITLAIKPNEPNGRKCRRTTTGFFSCSL